MAHVYREIDFHNAVHLMKNEFEVFSFKEEYKNDYKNNPEKTITLFKKNFEESDGDKPSEGNLQFFEQLLSNKIPVLTAEHFRIKMANMHQ